VKAKTRTKEPEVPEVMIQAVTELEVISVRSVGVERVSEAPYTKFLVSEGGRPRGELALLILLLLRL